MTPPITHEEAKAVINRLCSRAEYSPDVSERLVLAAYVEQTRQVEKERDELKALHAPRPLAIRNGVADMMVDELAKQYQKARCYGSLAAQWRKLAVELGAETDPDPRVGGVSNEAALEYARGVLSSAWRQSGETETVEDNARVAAVVKSLRAYVESRGDRFFPTLERFDTDFSKVLAEALK
jgi:hypothetical protein